MAFHFMLLKVGWIPMHMYTDPGFHKENMWSPICIEILNMCKQQYEIRTCICMYTYNFPSLLSLPKVGKMESAFL